LLVVASGIGRFPREHHAPARIVLDHHARDPWEVPTFEQLGLPSVSADIAVLNAAWCW
jgi:hypothetical protein